MTNATTPTPGNEIRVKCAEVMGIYVPIIGNFDKSNNHRPECQCDHCIPPYDTSCDAAMELVAALRKEGWWCDLNTLAGHWNCIFRRGVEMKSAAHESPKLAICLAFLATKGLEP